MYSYYSRTLKDAAIKPVLKARRGVWIVAQELTETDITELVQAHGLEEDVVRDATDYFEVPRVERENGIVYFFTRFPVQTPDGEMSTAPILLVLGEDFVLTITHKTPRLINKLLKDPAVYTTQRTKLFLQVLHAVTHEYNISITALRREVRKHFGHFDSISEKDIERFVGLENTVNDYIAALMPTQVALKETLKRNEVAFHETDEDLIEDLVLAHGQLVESGNTLARTIQNIRDAYSTIVAGRLNKVMKTLTALTIILTVPMIVTSFYGMNISLPFASSPHAAAGIFMIVILTSVAVGYFFARLRWF